MVAFNIPLPTKINHHLKNFHPILHQLHGHHSCAPKESIYMPITDYQKCVGE